MALAFELRSLVLELNAALAQCFHPLGLTCVQAEALLALDTIQPATLRQLAGHLVAESGHPSRLVSRLVERGLIERAPSPDDGRAVLLSLTEQGQDLARRADEARTPLIELVREHHGADLDQAVRLLRSLRASFTSAGDWTREAR